MRWTTLLLALLLPAGVSSLRAQTEYYARVGAIGASNLLHDVIVDPLTIRQSIAPMIAIGGALPLGGRGYRIGAEATLVSGAFHASEAGTDTELGTLRTASLLVDIGGRVVRDLRWRLGLGGLRYWPRDRDGIFREGGTTRLLAGVGLDYRRPVLRRWDVMTSVRYDFHRFTTGELDRRGFSNTQGVSRVSLSVGLSRGVR